MKLPNCEIDRNAKLTATEHAFGGLGLLSFILGLMLVGALCGCANSPRGIKVVASSASMTNLGDINWDEYKIPVFSVVSGPRSTVWVNKDYLALKRVKAGGAVTNDTSFIAIYSDKSGRENFIELEFQPLDVSGGGETNVSASASMPTDRSAEN